MSYSGEERRKGCGRRVSDSDKAQRSVNKAQAGQKKAEKALDKAEIVALKADASNKAKSEFLASMSHEIRTPMNAVMGLTNLLLASKIDQKQKRYLTVMQGSCEALLAMVNDLLDINKIEAQGIDLEDRPFNMTLLLDQIVSIMSVKAQEKGVDLTVHYDSGLYKTYRGDSGRIRQIVMNLIANALKFTKAGGEVRVVFANGGKGNGKKKVSISVIDTGIGIAADKLETIFGRFVQANPTISRNYG